MEIKPRSSMNGGDTTQESQSGQTPQPPAPSPSPAPTAATQQAPPTPSNSSASPTPTPTQPQPAFPQSNQVQQPTATQPAVTGDTTPKPFAMDSPSPDAPAVGQSATPANQTSPPSKPFDVAQAQSTPGVAPVASSPAAATTDASVGNGAPAATSTQPQPVAAAPQQPQPQSPAAPAAAPQAPQQPQPPQVQSPAPIASPAVASGSQSPPTQTPQPAQTGGTMPPSKSSPRKVNMPLIVGAATGFVVLLAAFVFGYYLPNRPENVYRTGIDRTGDVIHDLIVEATEAEQIEELSRMQVTGSMNITADDMEFEGSLTSRFDEQSSDSSFSIDFVDPNGTNPDVGLSGDVRTNIADGERLPDIYFQLTGMQSLGLDGFIPGIGRYDGRWIEISSAYLESTIGDEFDEIEDEADNTPSTEESAELVRAVSAVTNKYVFSSDEDTAVFEMVEYVDREDIGDLSTNRYITSINQANLSAYCSELAETVIRSEFNRKLSDLSDADIERNVTEAQEDCSEDNIDIDDDYTFDLWVDRRTKLIHKARFYDTESDNRNNYIELGQRYDGGDELEFFTNIKSEDDDFDVSSTLRTNLETNKSTSSFNFEQRGTNAYDIVATLEIEPYNESIDIERPAGSVTIEQLMNDLFGTSVLGVQTELDQEEDLDLTTADEFVDEMDAEQSQEVEVQSPEPTYSPLQDFYERYIR